MVKCEFMKKSPQAGGELVIIHEFTPGHCISYVNYCWDV